MNFDFNRMKVLAAVARHGTMTGAAEELAYTASAVSQQVKRLEAEVRAPVLERHPRGVVLTEAGAAIVEAEQAIDRQLRMLQNRLDDLAGARAGALRLGIFPTFAASVLPEAILRFRAQYPGIDLTITSSRMAPLRELLAARDLDMALIWDYPWSQREDESLVAQDLMADPTVLLLAKGHRLASRTRIAVEDLKDETWVVRANAHPTRDVLTRSASAAGFDPRIAIECNDYPEVQAMVAAGLGVSLCPALATEPLRGDVVVKHVEDPLPVRRIRTAHLVDRKASPAYSAMRSVMRDVVAARSALKPAPHG